MIDSTIPEISQDYLRTAWDDMRAAGFHLGDEDRLGLTADFRRDFHAAFFTPRIVRRYDGDIPADRERAREVIRYDWVSEDQVDLASHHTVAINRAGREGPCDFDRVDLLSHPGFREWTTGMLSLVPEEYRLDRGTFGVNLFRTRTNVVTGPHQDHERFIVIYVLDKAGDGAETSLHDITDERVVAKTVLQPGEFVIFDDTRFKHSASPLVGVDARRDVLVCTVNYAGTYPL
ncbi:2OG-Fe dioxygenase family protein [Actinocrispum sp. NPDC049592]|uniref:2OG-Fe dioxygenase family protein n=1 Tax=Actinocrispum sp. NPDC049592 TaxID=3154835 RepID=UPI003420A5BB